MLENQPYLREPLEAEEIDERHYEHGEHQEKGEQQKATCAVVETCVVAALVFESACEGFGGVLGLVRRSWFFHSTFNCLDL